MYRSPDPVFLLIKTRSLIMLSMVASSARSGRVRVRRGTGRIMEHDLRVAPAEQDGEIKIIKRNTRCTVVMGR